MVPSANSKASATPAITPGMKFSDFVPTVTVKKAGVAPRAGVKVTVTDWALAPEMTMLSPAAY